MMWELGNLWTEGRSSTSVHAMMHEINVLLVDHDSEALITTAKQLEMCQYRVTYVELASAAISILLSGKAKFDVVIANINSPDLHGFKLLQHAVTMGLPVVLMSTEENAFMAMRALENGAFLYIKKPATMEILRCLWQHVLREKTRLIRQRDMFVAANNVNGQPPVRSRGEYREGVHPREPENPNWLVMNNNNKDSGRKKKWRHSPNDEEFDSQNPVVVHNNVRRKMCTEWTHDLHAKFMDAVEELGEGRCFPKEILEMMNVPGLTRMQVASHLQKCRNDNWRSPEDRKPQLTLPTTQNTHVSHPKPRRFGSKPQVGRAFCAPQVQQESQDTGRGSITYSMADTPTVGNGSTVTHTHRHKKYGSMVPSSSRATPGKNSSSNPSRHSTDEFFNFPEVDCLIQNISGGPKQGTGMNNPNPANGATQFTPAYNDEQNSGGGSMETRSNWSSETSNFESDHSETCRGSDNDE